MVVSGSIEIKYDKENDSYIAYSTTLGGPVVFGKTKDEAIAKYKSFKVVSDFVNLCLLEENNRLN